MLETADRISDQEYCRLRALIESECGVILPPAKRLMLETRLRRRARAIGAETLSAYCVYLESREGRASEWPHFIDTITTHKTDFFREASHFEYLVEQTIPDLAESGAGSRKPLMVWSSACSTGEEPYTLAMVLGEYALSIAPRNFYYRIFGTDIALNVLETARTAIYSEAAISAIPASLRKKYVRRSKDPRRAEARLVPEIRSRVTFQQLNLMDPSYGFEVPFDVAFCRNVMIYFDRPTQQRVLMKICGALRPGGYLFMGHSESLHGLDLPLMQMVPTVYRRAM